MIDGLTEGAAAVGAGWLTGCPVVVVTRAVAAVGVWRVDSAVAATRRAAACTGTVGAPVLSCAKGKAAVVAVGVGWVTVRAAAGAVATAGVATTEAVVGVEPTGKLVAVAGRITAVGFAAVPTVEDVDAFTSGASVGASAGVRVALDALATLPVEAAVDLVFLRLLACGFVFGAREADLSDASVSVVPGPSLDEAVAPLVAVVAVGCAVAALALVDCPPDAPAVVSAWETAVPDAMAAPRPRVMALAPSHRYGSRGCRCVRWRPLWRCDERFAEFVRATMPPQSRVPTPDHRMMMLLRLQRENTDPPVVSVGRTAYFDARTGK